MAESIASYQEKIGMTPDRILPTKGDLDLFEYEALAAARTTISQGLNRIRAGLARGGRKILHE